jgi:hypothetical protein
MTTLYEFCVGYTKLGIGAAPSSAPTITVIDSANNVLVAGATATTALTNLVGAYRYSYSGADGLICYAKFTTTDATMDQQDLFTAALINPIIQNIHDTDLPAVKSDTAAILTDTGTTLPATLTNIDGDVADVQDAVNDVQTTADSILVDTGTTLDGKINTIDTVVDAVKVKTDLLSATPAADVWSNGTRTLTQAAESVTAAVTADSITVIRGDTASISLTNLGSLANLSKLYFTVKGMETDPDTASIIQIEKTDGLKYLNGAAGTAGNGSLVITDEPTGDITITLAAVEVAKLDIAKVTYDVQIVRTSGVPVSTLAKGSFIVISDITNAVA